MAASKSIKIVILFDIIIKERRKINPVKQKNIIIND